MRFAAENDTTLSGYLGYLATLSTFKRYEKRMGKEEGEKILNNFALG